MLLSENDDALIEVHWVGLGGRAGAPLLILGDENAFMGVTKSFPLALLLSVATCLPMVALTFCSDIYFFSIQTNASQNVSSSHVVGSNA